MSEMPLEIDVATLAGLRESATPPLVVDVREDWERDLVALTDAQAIPLGEIPQRIAEIPRDRQVVMMCHHGARSGRAVAWLRTQGYDNVTNLAGGIHAWAETIDPRLPTY